MALEIGPFLESGIGGQKSGMGDLEAKDVVRLLVKCKVAEVDEKAIRELLGDRHATTLAELADGFDVSETTVRNTWRRGNNKIPGTTTRGGRGKFVWADCLLWYWRMRKEASAGRGVDEDSRRKRLAEADIAEIDRDLRRLRLEREEGELVSAAVARSEFASIQSLFRDDVLAWPEQMLPLLPKKQAPEIVANLENHLNKSLTALADRCERVIEDQLERTEDDV